LQRDDRILAVNGTPTGCDILVNRALRQHPCDSVTLLVLRGGEQLTLSAFLGDQGTLGCYPRSKYTFFATEHRDYGFFESIPAGVAYGWDMLKNYVKQFRLVFSKEGAQSLGGFGAIGSMFPSVWNWYLFWYMTAFLSLILAFMNFLPIPALDGGYILFLIFEMLTGRQPSDKFLERANNIGWVLLLALLIFANGNDIFKYFF
jgi:regulator of sigma E protease